MKHLEKALDGQNQFWKYLINFITGLFASNTIGIIPLLVVGLYACMKNNVPVSAMGDITNLSHLGISHNINLLLLMIPFVVALGVTIILLKSFHQRTLAETINGTKQIRWKRYFIGFGCWFGVAAIYQTADYLINPTDYLVQFDAGQFIGLIAICLVFIPIQTAYEEILFRGYFAQGIGAATGSRWLAFILPSIAFGLMHIANPEVEAFGFAISMAQYISFGLIFGLITILDDGIELAMGLHAANNLFLCLFVTNDSSALQTPAVLKQLSLNPAKETISLIILGTIVVFILSRIFKWDFKILNKRVEINQE